AIVDIFKAPTIAALAAMLDAREPAAHAPAAVPLIGEDDRARLPAGVEEAYPVTMLQMGMVFHNQLEQDAGLYHDVLSHCIDVPAWDAEAMRIVLDALSRKHPVLRTAFGLRGFSQPMQLVHALAHIPLTVNDLTAMDTAAQDEAVAAFIDAERKTGFDFDAPPLLRLFVHLRSRTSVQFTLSFHHAILDGWSVASLQTELFNAYLALLRSGDRRLYLAPLAITPASTALRERQALAAPDHKEFWNTYLADYAFAALPPAAGDEPPAQAVRRKLPADLCARLQALAAELEVPVRTLLLCAHMRLVSTLTGRDDVTTGLVSNVRPEEADGDKVLGLFLNTLPFRQKLARASWKTLIADTYRAELGVMAHRDYPYFQLHLDNGRQPFYEIMFNYTNFHVYDNLDALASSDGYSQVFEATDHALVINCSYNASQGIDFHADTRQLSGAQVDQVLASFVAILASMAQAPDEAHDEQSFLCEQQRELVLRGFNDTAMPPAPQQLVHAMFEAQAAATPDAPALRCGDAVLSYAQLNARANRLAHHLRALGVQGDDRVAICVERSIDMIVGLLGILKAGAGYVPLDPAYPADRLAFMLDDCLPAALLTQSALAGKLPATGAALVLLDGEADMAAVARHPVHNPDVPGMSSNRLAYVIYTSGSTGLPKGVMVEHGNAVNLLAYHIDLCQMGAGDRVLQFASIGFDASVTEIFPGLAAGAQIVLRPAHLMLPDQEFIDFLDMQAITVADLPTAFWHQWAAGKVQAGKSLRLVIVGGEKAELRYLTNWYATPAMAQVRWINTYGPTETTIYATAIVYDAASPLPATELPIGRPVANTQIYILDRFGQPAPLGVTGEIHIGGAQVTRAYLNRPELTREKYIPDPFSKRKGARLYKSGDLGRWLADGSVEYLGRNDFQVKLRGYRIELGEIETRLAACDGVREAMVMVREDQRLVAYLTTDGAQRPAVASLRNRLAAELAEYMVPSAFVMLDAFPITTNGKIDRRALPAPDMAALLTSSYEAPVGEAEIAIAAIWQSLLGLEQVGRNDHFFELGGHSLIVVTLIEQLRQHGWQADVRSVFSAPTPASLARLLTSADGGVAIAPNRIGRDSKAITPDMLPLVSLSQADIDGIVARVPGGIANVADIYPLSPLQNGILFHHLLESEGDPYLLRLVLSFDRRSRLDTFLSALQIVIDRHDILRTAVLWTGLDDPVQVVVRDAALPLCEVAVEAGHDALQQLLKQADPRHLRLDLQRAPLLAAHVAADPVSGECHLALLNHHLIGDHVSQELIIAEIQAIIQGRSDSLPVPVPYRNFIAQMGSVSDAQHEAYFREQLAGIDEPTAPFGLLNVQGSGARVEEATVALSDALALRLRETARRCGVTPAVLFHVAWAQVLGQTSARKDVVFGSVLLGRMQGTAGADQVLGMFVNTLPVRVALAGATVGEAVDAAYRQLTDLLMHEQAPLTLAQRCSGVAAPAPLFTSLLNYRHSHARGAQEQQAADLAWDGIRTHANEERISYPVGISVNDFGVGFSITSQCEGVDPARVAAMLVQAADGLTAALDDDPARLIASLDVLPPAERELVLNGFNER
ncbi:amino acid adenylation domain-containing protein, partial [Massilia atriviolacea]